MSFINDCCRERFNPEAETGDEFTCVCKNQFIHDGEKWRNVLDIGSRKTDKFRRIRTTNHNLRRLAASDETRF